MSVLNRSSLCFKRFGGKFLAAGYAGRYVLETIMESSIQERENTLKILDKHLNFLSGIYRECYLQKGKGAIVLYPFLAENILLLSCIDYNNKDQIIDLFDNRKSREDLSKLIDSYDPKNQGILILITKSNATWFVTIKLKSPIKKND